MNIFFSHSADDAPLVVEMVEILSVESVQSFYSSAPETGVLAGEGIMARINKEITQCQLFVPIITENYVRSQYCMYELSVAAFLQAQNKLKIIPIVNNQNTYNRIGTILKQFDLLYISAEDPKAPRIFLQAFSWVNTEKIVQVATVLEKLAEQTKSKRPYIGMPREQYADILEYCETYGIRQFKNTTLPMDMIKKKIAEAEEMIVLSTTGASLIKGLCTEAFPKALSRGCRISVVVPNQHSAFCQDVAEIERPDSKEENAARLAQEFDAVQVYLKDAVASAGENKGSVTCYCSHTLLRQTILIVRDKEDRLWSWVSLTLPPKRTIDGTPAFEVEGNMEQGNLAYVLWQHCQAIMHVSRQRGTFFDAGSNSKPPFYLETIHAREYWKARYEKARSEMDNRRGQYDCALIEVAAQHPLKQRKLPGVEFKRRLDFAIDIHHKLEQQGIASCFYVPGSRHRHNGVNDQVSLSYAGVQYLLGKGIDEEIIYGEDMNDRYKGAAGVYNSADECYVASRIFQDGEFDQLICVCSPNQIMRKTLFYMQFGLIPQCYGVPSEKLYHNVLDELFDDLQQVLYEDHDWQDPQGEAYRYYRQKRMPMDE